MRLTLFLLCGLFIVTSCRDDFSLEAPFQDIPVVFAYLDPADDEHFVRVQRLFFGVDGNAEVSATSPDSLYYGPEDATVTVSQGNLGPITLERVDGGDFGLDREDGVFVDDPNVLYRFDRDDLDLRPGNPITIVVDRPGRPAATAVTEAPSPLMIVQPSTSVVIENYRNVQNWRWNASTASRVFDVRLYINVREFFTGDPSQNRDRRLEWVITEQLIPEEDETRVVLQFRNERFWQFLGQALTPDPNVRRVIDDMELVVTAVGGEIEEQLELENANTGITSAQALPVFTNVTNGLGIVTSRTVAVQREISLDPRNLDTLRNGIYTRQLNFQ